MRKISVFFLFVLQLILIKSNFVSAASGNCKERNNYQIQLKQAIVDGDVSWLQELISEGEQDYSIYELLKIAAENNRENIAQFLMQRDPQIVYMQENDGNTPLMIAVENNFTDIAKLFILRGFNVNETRTSTGGDTPLFLAIKNDNVELVIRLIDAGASVNARRIDNNKTVLECAIEVGVKNNNKNLIRAVLNANPNFSMSEQLYYAIEKNSLTLAALLFEYDVPLNEITCDFVSTAVRNNNIDLARFLVDRGANLNIGRGEKPLIEAIKNGQIEFAKFLVERGADVNARSVDGLTVMDISNTYGNSELTDFLIDHGNQNSHLFERVGMQFVSFSELINSIPTVDADDSFSYTYCLPDPPENNSVVVGDQEFPSVSIDGELYLRRENIGFVRGFFVPQGFEETYTYSPQPSVSYTYCLPDPPESSCTGFNDQEIPEVSSGNAVYFGQGTEGFVQESYGLIGRATCAYSIQPPPDPPEDDVFDLQRENGGFAQGFGGLIGRATCAYSIQPTDSEEEEEDSPENALCLFKKSNKSFAKYLSISIKKVTIGNENLFNLVIPHFDYTVSFLKLDEINLGDTVIFAPSRSLCYSGNLSSDLSSDDEDDINYNARIVEIDESEESSEDVTNILD